MNRLLGIFRVWTPITIVVAVLLLAAALAAEGQPVGKVTRIGLLHPGLRPQLDYEVFRQALRDLGYVEGRNIVIEERLAEGKAERLRSLAAELVRLKVDVIITNSTPGIRAAKEATSRIPIVMTGSADPVGAGLVANLARPGGNITGLSIMAPDLDGKRLELLKETVPKVPRMAMLLEAANRGMARRFEATRVAARALGVSLHPVEVQQPFDFETAFAKMTKAGAGALLVPNLFNSYSRELVDLATKHRIPTLYDSRHFVEAGGLMAYGPSTADQYRRAAAYVDKILKGAKPGELAIEQPTKFELLISLKAAKSLGLTIPQALLLRADQIIE